MNAALEDIWRWLEAVPDPEIPVISVVELGVIRAVQWKDACLHVSITPTYSGCPATRVIALDIETALRDRGIEELRIHTQLSPAWSTDWLSPEAHEKLRKYGIAPPHDARGPEKCPRCDSKHLSRISQFGSTPCKAQWRCDDCLEPFDYFKCL